MKQTVRVIGAGVVSALGVGASAVARAVAEGREFAAFQGPSPDRAAYPSPFDANRDLPRGLGRRLGRQLAMSLAAALDAVGAGRAWAEAPQDTGVFASSAHGPVHETIDFIGGALRDGPRYASPLLFSGAQHNAMVGLAARELGIRGPALVVSNGDVSFETALLAAVAGLRGGRMRRALVVGSDAWHPLYARSLETFGLVSDDASPVDPTMRRTTRGMHLGEGAGALLLEIGGSGPDGVRLDDVTLGAATPRFDVAPTRVESMASGDAASARRHAAALAALRLDGARVGHPAARFGSFASLSAVAVGAEAARRLSSPDDGGSTLLACVPRDAAPACVVLSGSGAA